MTPGRIRSEECVRVACVESPLGPLVAGATDHGICFLEFADCGEGIAPGEHKHLGRLKTELEEYFAGSRREFSVPLDAQGTPFQRMVWDELHRIPYGETRSYEDMARNIGKPRAVRAVGHANGLNRIAILLPCHRVVNKSGALGGYGGGLWRKQFLLNLERAPGHSSLQLDIASFSGR
jgi:AraC family transcriptional regulator of adaptative response/methylated-DNA-[protein]-cysteine methyltransferase